ncbi:hypothetical protein BIT28_25335 [Photobacterium proteolyticum]|uniref:Uncharacterized protein n=1 Tax=Photobacterium proteolyticum TaxID=1903952 RepID=A0A1Q9GFD8_9GAMM|nr:hypothetical protein [Photobacterium proteolyticum]OLQ73151.1 hypothetical protein BIT28_25335 [Photobacterium proteolyticum]
MAKENIVRVRIDDVLDNKLKSLCTMDGESPSSVVRKLIRLYVDNHPMTDKLWDVSFEVTNLPETNEHAWYSYILRVELNGDLSLLESDELTFLLPEFFEDNGYEPYRVDSAYYHRKAFPNCTGKKGRFLGAKLTKGKWKGAIFIYRDSLLDTPDICFEEIKKNMKANILSGLSKHLISITQGKLDDSILGDILANKLVRDVSFIDDQDES